MLDIFLQSMAVVPVLLAVGAGLLILRRNGFDRTATLSVQAATNPKTAYALTLTLLIAGVLYWLNLWLWIVPKYELENMDVILMVALVGLLVLAFFPADSMKKASATLHSAAGTLLLVFMFVFGAMVAITPGDDAPGLIGKIAAWSFLIVALLLMVFYALSSRARKEVFMLQLGYVGTFYIFIIIATFS